MSVDRVCWRCASAVDVFPSRDQLAKLFAIVLPGLASKAELLASMVSDLAKHCAPCTDIVLKGLVAYCDLHGELVTGGANADEAETVMNARIERLRRGDSTSE